MAATDALRARNAEFWDAAAPGWIRHAERHDSAGRPLGAAAMAALNPVPGERILDVGCAAGGTTAELALAVSPTGEAVGLDLSAALIGAARGRFPGLTFHAADIETVGAVPGAPFDGAFSRMALMLLADPVAGCATIRRSLRPGGRLAATVFRDSASTPWLAAALLGAAPHVGPLPPLPLGDEPGPFAFADESRVRRVLAASGFADPGVRAHDVTLIATEPAEVVAEWLIELGPAGAAYRSGDPAARAAARNGTSRLLERFRADGTAYHLPTGIWVITAYS
ncbi:SAM-dependent methyltransferase [Allocatelliglobosispora scoriae]|uniref:SAM-dependent methyltransferase n=1 Tax=Allocatelliglobosispora scoriae TaxID=643052 RepID=A0A841BQ64_9ACTN|nr:methyltransferase domain-containing protein [Allocatelliglobosispora scoriae]MBB5869835.1 SAM-dependent methyltransferase [Allocatelliglobosispora scoriae]